jgi:hypothetical protein
MPRANNSAFKRREGRLYGVCVYATSDVFLAQCPRFRERGLRANLTQIQLRLPFDSSSLSLGFAQGRLGASKDAGRHNFSVFSSHSGNFRTLRHSRRRFPKILSSPLKRPISPKSLIAGWK